MKRGLSLLFTPILLIYFFSPWLRAESQRPLGNIFDVALFRVKSTYIDEDSKEPVKVYGMGTLLQTTDTSGEPRWVLLTASHVSQGTKDLKMQLFENAKPSYSLEIETNPLTHKPWRLADNEHDVEAIVVRPPPWISNLAIVVSQTIQNAFSYSFFPKYEIGLDSIFCGYEFRTAPHREQFYALTPKAFIPLSPTNKGQYGIRPLEASPKIDPTSFHSLLFPWATGFGYRNWQKDNVTPVLVPAGFSGSPVFEFGRLAMTGVIKSVHRFMPRTYLTDSQQIIPVLVALLQTPSIKSHLNETRWHMKAGAMYRSYGAKQDYFEVNPLMVTKVPSSPQILIPTGGHSTGDVGKGIDNTASASYRISPGLTQKIHGKFKNILAYLLQDGAVYADWESKKWIEDQAKRLKQSVNELIYPPEPKQMFELLKKRAEKAKANWEIENQYFKDFWQQDRSKIEWIFEQMFGQEILSQIPDKLVHVPLCKVKEFDSKHRFVRISIKVPEESLTTELKLNHLGQLVNDDGMPLKDDLNPETIPFGVITTKLASGKLLKTEVSGLFFLDYKLADHFSVKLNKDHQFAWPFVKSLFSFPQWFGNARWTTKSFEFKSSNKNSVTKNSQETDSGPITSRLGNAYLEAAYVTLKTEMDQSGWPVTCVLAP